MKTGELSIKKESVIPAQIDDEGENQTQNHYKKLGFVHLQKYLWKT